MDIRLGKVSAIYKGIVHIAHKYTLKYCYMYTRSRLKTANYLQKYPEYLLCGTTWSNENCSGKLLEYFVIITVNINHW